MVVVRRKADATYEVGLRVLSYKGGWAACYLNH